MAKKNRVQLAFAKKEMLKREKLKSYQDDFVKFSEEQVNIITKDAKQGFVPFVLNEAQHKIHEAIEKQRKETGRVRAIILKARQQGISTYVAGRAFWRTTQMPHTKTVVMAHDATTSDQLFDMTRNIVAYQAPEFRPETSKASAKELKFKDNGSSYRVYTAGSPDAGRGTTPVIFHGSEVAFWPHDEKVLAGIFQGVATSDDTEIILESTANGAQGEFYRLWQGAVAGENEFIPVFLPWYMTSEYTIDLPPGFEKTPEEAVVAKKFDLTDGQIAWRRMKIAQSGELKFKQEYPSTAEEAFIASGSHVFNLEKVREYVPSNPEVVRNFNYEQSTWLDSETGKGQLEIWKFPRHGDKFVIAADVAQGVGQDYSTAVVMSPDQEIVALFRDNLIDAATFGDVLFYLGRYYNNCLVAVENNAMGQATVHRLGAMNYPQLYYRVKQNRLTHEETPEPGWKTTASSKPPIIANLKREVEELNIQIPSRVILQELTEYIVSETGKMTATHGNHDDTVMALAIGIEVLRTHGASIRSDAFTWANKYRDLLYEDKNKWL